MGFFLKRNGMSKRFFAFAVAITIGWVILIIRLVGFQIINSETYKDKVMDQLLHETKTTPERGKIYDSDMNLLATNVTVYRVSISPYHIAIASLKAGESVDDEEAVARVMAQDMSQNPTAQLIANKLSELLRVDYSTIIEKAKKTNRKDETIKKEVDADLADEIRRFISENKLGGMINLIAESKRYYCYGDLASHVLGFTNADGDGSEGVEAAYNEQLKGTAGKYIVARNAKLQDMHFKYESYVEAVNGANLVLTLNLRLQYELENQLKTAYESAEAGNRVCGVAMDPKTGAILAMAVYPSFDCNNPRELVGEFLTELEDSGFEAGSEDYNNLKKSLLYEMWNNKCISETYEPGSTFKVITAAIALEEDAVKITDKFNCRGSYVVSGTTIRCHKAGGHGLVTFARGLQQSCNPTMMMTVERIGLDAFYKYYQALGYTTRTGVDLPGETFGIFHEKEAMHATELAVYSFGQTFKASPLQQLTAICTVANGGYLVTPHVVQEMIDNDGNTIMTYDPGEKRQIFSEETCKTLTAILAEGVATDGGAKNAYVKGYSVAAKTGTSEKRDKYDENGERPFRVGSCLAYAPADDPQIAVLIVVDEPMSGGVYGSIVAAPYISKFLSSALPYIGVEPQYTEEELANMDVAIADLTGFDVSDATLYITNRKVGFKIIGNGNIVTAQSPVGGSRLSTENGTVYLYTGDELPSDTITVPNVIGKSAYDCNKELINSKLNIRIEGAQNYNEGVGAKVVSQSPAAGTVVSQGTIVTVEFMHLDGTD